jgi:hypothetical protein
MLTVDDYGKVRRAHRDGMSIREIALDKPGASLATCSGKDHLVLLGW